MSWVWVSIGSNTQRTSNVRGAVAHLRRAYGFVCVSQVYETAAVGFDGAAFYNLVARFETAQAPDQVLAQLHGIEAAHGRDCNGPKFGSRTLDIDMLLYDGLIGEVAGKPLPHPDILKYPFVLGPLAELTPDSMHAETGKSDRQLWLERPAAQREPLVPVPFRWLED